MFESLEFLEARGESEAPFEALVVVREQTLTLNGPIEDVFPLTVIGQAAASPDEIGNRSFYFTPEGPELAGTLYATISHSPNAPPNLWYVADYDLNRYSTRYIIIYPNIEWEETEVRCSPGDDKNTTISRVTHRMIGLSERGNTAIRNWTASEQGKNALTQMETSINAALSRKDGAP